jgi:hypothetical protein
MASSPNALEKLRDWSSPEGPVLRRSSQDLRSWYVFSGERRWPSGTIPSTAQRTARLLVLGFELADHSLGLVVEGGEDPVGVLSP